jgi:hypothetical protein
MVGRGSSGEDQEREREEGERRGGSHGGIE